MVVTGLSANSVPYIEALELQRATHRAVVSGSSPDTVLLLEHPSVYTAGKRTEDFERPSDGTPVDRRRPRGQDHLARAGTARGIPDPAASGPDRRRRIRPSARGNPHRGAGRTRHRRWTGRRTIRSVDRVRPAGRRREDRGHRHPSRRRRNDARILVELLQLVRGVRQDRRVRNPRRRGHLRSHA